MVEKSETSKPDTAMVMRGFYRVAPSIKDYGRVRLGGGYSPLDPLSASRVREVSTGNATEGSSDKPILRFKPYAER